MAENGFDYNRPSTEDAVHQWNNLKFKGLVENKPQLVKVANENIAEVKASDKKLSHSK